MALFNFFHKNTQNQRSGLKHIENTNQDTFNSVQQNIENIIASRSVINNNLSEFYRRTPSFAMVSDNLDIMPVITDKGTRIKQYRTIAAFPECDWCLDEIADDFLHEDENGNFINLKINQKVYGWNETREDAIQNEFDKFVNLFKFRDEGFYFVKRFLIEGELAWENIINPEHPDLGIVGLKFLPTEYYETLVNATNGTKVGLYFDVQKFGDALKTIISMSYYGSHKVFNAMIGTTNTLYNRENCIAMYWPQLTYISSSERSQDGMISFPIIEKAKQAYYQFVLMQDAAVILRVTHAPERLLFNINTGGMSDKVAQSYVRDFGNQLKQKKIVVNSPDGPRLENMYNSSTMLDSWIFGKSSQNEGTTVDSIGTNVTYDQIDDIKFFLKRLLKQFKVPYTRFEAPEQMNERNEQISYEEYDFSRMEIRLQRKFAIAIKKSFITHLKLRGIWEKYGLKDQDIDIKFVPPVLYELYETQKLMEAKVAAYAQVADRDEFSKISAMKNIMGMKDEDIEENFQNIIKEKMYMQQAEWYANQLDSNGPAKIDAPIPVKDLENTPGEGEGEGGGEQIQPEGEEGGEETEEAPAEEGEGGEGSGEAGGEAPAPEGFGLGS